MSQAMVPSTEKSGTLQCFLNSPEALSKLAAVARGFMKAEDLCRMALVAAHRNPQLLACTQASILAALMDAAELKIKPGGMNGRGYLIPRKNRNTGKMECCFDPGWRGLTDIMRRSGEVKRIEAHPVFTNDKVKVVYGLNPVFEHEPCLDEDRGEIVCAYAMAEFKDGTFQVEFLTKSDLKKIRAASASSSGPWSSWEDEMSRKSAVRRLAKWMPTESSIDKATQLADKVDTIDVAAWDVETGEITDGGAPHPAQLPVARTDNLKDQLRARAQANVPREPGDDSDEDGS